MSKACGSLVVCAHIQSGRRARLGTWDWCTMCVAFVDCCLFTTLAVLNCSTSFWLLPVYPLLIVSWWVFSFFPVSLLGTRSTSYYCCTCTCDVQEYFVLLYFVLSIFHFSNFPENGAVPGTGPFGIWKCQAALQTATHCRKSSLQPQWVVISGDGGRLNTLLYSSIVEWIPAVWYTAVYLCMFLLLCV